jgi:uncharacterized Rmd1/YagE family protein
MAVYKIKAFQVAEQLNLKHFKSIFPEQPVSGTGSELFYHIENESYLYLSNYGVAAFTNLSPERTLEFMERLKPYATNWLENQHQEGFTVESFEELPIPEVQSDRVIIPNNFPLPGVLKLTMLQVAHSVALDYYEELTYSILSDSYTYTRQLEEKGKVNISKRNLMRFIGKTLNVKNSIVDNLYILDDHGSVWNDPQLDKLNKGLKDTFDIQVRFRDIDFKLKIVEDNLKLFTDLLQHRESSRLEWIIIILILIEVVNVFWRELF